MRIAIVAGLGVALGLYLVIYVGWGAVLQAAVTLGWSGFALLCAYALGLFALLGAGWSVLLPAAAGAGYRVCVWARMVRDAASEVLPFSQLGGIVLGGRAAVLHGLPRPLAFASVVVDVTTEMLAQIAFIALGIAILSAYGPRTSFAGSLVRALEIGLAIAVLAGGVFLALQRHGHLLAERLAARLLPGALATATAVGEGIDAIYRSPGRVVLSVLLHLAGWIVSAIGIWIAFRLVGAGVALIKVIAIESLVCGARSMAFVVPNALGVQEAAYAVLAPLFGVGAEIGLAVSLIKRARDIAVGVPILAVWQTFESQRALATAASGGDTRG